MSPTACKVMQLWLQCRLPRTHAYPNVAQDAEEPPPRTFLTPEPSCKEMDKRHQGSRCCALHELPDPVPRILDSVEILRSGRIHGRQVERRRPIAIEQGDAGPQKLDPVEMPGLWLSSCARFRRTCSCWMNFGSPALCVLFGLVPERWIEETMDSHPWCLLGVVFLTFDRTRRARNHPRAADD